MKVPRETPEEKLLKIIEKHGEGEKYIKTFSRRRKQQEFLRNLYEIVTLKWLDKDKILNLHVLNLFLVGVSVILTIFLGYGFISQKAHLTDKYSKMIKPLPKEEYQREEEILPVPEVRDIILETKRRNIFTLTPEAKKEEAQKRLKPFTVLKLVGILWSEDNPQAMIEDSEDKKTYILNKGDQIDRWKIERITRDKVVLVDEEGEWELK